ncbi:tonsoku-like protein [Oppia nitens]|uniref:tonsoku-like protein n=1 Tax=Oppia nitens TaxID=1686743 RepID=UPI0023DB0496|nr:tonsoku-like protein [Oppia nitens]
MDNKLIKELKGDKIKAKNCKDVKELIKICNCLGRRYLQTFRYNEAIDEHKEELQYGLSIGCMLSEAIARRALGECYSEINEYQKALFQHKKYLDLAMSLADDIEIQRAWATIGRTHLLHAQELYQSNSEINEQVLNDAKNAFKMALNLCDELSEIKDKELAEMRSRLYLNLGLVFELMGQFSESMTHLHLSIAINKRYGFIEDLFRSQFSLATIYEKNKEFNNSLEAYNESLKSAKILKNKFNSCDALIGKGLLLTRWQKFEEGRHCLKKAYKLCPNIDEDKQKVLRYLKISSIICDDYRELMKATELHQKIVLCDKLGDHFVELKFFDLAIDFYKKELDYAFQCNKGDTEIANIYVSIAQTFADDLKYKDAIDYFKHELNCNSGNSLEESKSLIKIAEMEEYLKNNEYNTDIIKNYEMAIEKVGTTDKLWLIDIIQRYITFLQNRQLNYDRIDKLKQQLKELNLQKTTVCERVENEEEDDEDIYDKYILNDLSDVTTDSDEESVSNIYKLKRMGKSLKRNELGETPLHMACIKGEENLVSKLITDKHPVNVRDNCGWTPLHEATNNGFPNIVKILLDNGANINDNEGQKCKGITPLHDACINGHLDVIRLLLEKGAKVTILDNYNNTALDLLLNWRKSKADVIDKDQLNSCKQLEQKMEDLLKMAGFSKKNIPISKSSKSISNERRKFKPMIRNRETNCNTSDSDSDSLNVSINSGSQKTGHRPRTKHMRDLDKDFDDPRVARREYCSSISNLRPNSDSSKQPLKTPVRPNAKSMPALVDQRNLVTDDDWLIRDTNDNRKRSCLDAYDVFNKKTKINQMSHSNTGHFHRRKTNGVSIQRRPEKQIHQNEDESKSSDSEDIETTEPVNRPPKSTQLNKELRKVEEISKQVMPSNSLTNSDIRTLEKSIPLRVCVCDDKNTTFIIPILNRRTTCLWLNKETEKRYFAKLSIKPIISLETTDGALLSDEDFILDVITGDILKVNAKIESWIMDPLPNRYKEVCNTFNTKPDSDVIGWLEMTHLNGCLRLCDLKLPVEQIRAIFKAIQRQNNLKEIDISFSNILMNDWTSFINCLPFLSSLHKLKLKGTSINRQIIEQLIAKCPQSLVELDLSFNTFGDYYRNITYKLIQHLPKLKVLDLSGCDLTNAFLEPIELQEYIKSKF